MSTIPQVRPSAIAGSWYTDDPVKLDLELQSFLDKAEVEPPEGKVMGLIAPHAGYFYSGRTAAYAYRMIMGKEYDVVAVFSPLHDFLPYDLLTSAHQSYSTPLGHVPIDRELLELCIDSVSDNTGVSIVQISQDHEHSLEIQLPFLQKTLGQKFTLLPFMVRTHAEGLLKETANALADVLEGKKILLVASTDLSHFLNESEARILDKHMLAQVTDFSPEGVLKAERSGTGSACGAGAVALVLWLARDLGANQVTLLRYATSAEASKDTHRVVGYGSAVITRN